MKRKKGKKKSENATSTSMEPMSILRICVRSSPLVMSRTKPPEEDMLDKIVNEFITKRELHRRKEI